MCATDRQATSDALMPTEQALQSIIRAFRDAGMPSMLVVLD